MVERTEVVREARRTAEAIVEHADRQAAQIRHEAEDYVDRKLAAFEVVLDRTMQQVQKGRERLQVNVPAETMEPEVGDERRRLLRPGRVLSRPTGRRVGVLTW